MSEPVKLRVCVCKGSDCRLRGSDLVFGKLRELVQAEGLSGRCEVARGGCYGQCAFGPNVVIRPADPGRRHDPLSGADYQLLGTPEETHYAAMTPEKVVTVVREHLVGGRRVEELVFDLKRAVLRRSGS